MNRNKNKGFTPPHFLSQIKRKWREARDKNKLQEKSASTKSGAGFTLIELLVVISIIALLSSIALIALMSAREKSRDAKRLGDMTEMNNALELYFADYKGYPSETNGIPESLIGPALSSIPTAPGPSDGLCIGAIHSAACVAGDSNCNNVPANTYYYVPSGTAFTGNNNTEVYPGYNYYFCLGNQTGNFSGGEHILTPLGVR